MRTSENGESGIREHDRASQPSFRGLYLDKERRIFLREEPLKPLGANEVRVRAEFASIKHGTEFHNLDPDSPFAQETLDPAMRLFVPRPEAERGTLPTIGYAGNTAVGVIIEVGQGVSALRPGDRVYGYAPVCNLFTLPADRLNLLPPDMTETDAVCLDPALYAYAAVRDARACLGDSAIVFGLGAIGLLVVQMLRRAGCLHIAAVDPLEKRRSLAQQLGAEQVFDPRAGDVGIEIRRWLGRGVDFAIEASGSYHALRDALRAVQTCGRVVTLGYYHGHAAPLELAKEWMHNRLELISSMPTWGNPPRDYPLWTEERLVRTVAELFECGLLASQPLLDPIVAFDDSARAFEALYHDPSGSIKLGIRFAPEPARA